MLRSAMGMGAVLTWVMLKVTGALSGGGDAPSGIGQSLVAGPLPPMIPPGGGHGTGDPGSTQSQRSAHPVPHRHRPDTARDAVGARRRAVAQAAACPRAARQPGTDGHRAGALPPDPPPDRARP